MSTLVGRIEAHLTQLLEAARGGRIEIRRCELAEAFQCAPSQINYVLKTRFTPEKGFVVESRRGGGGYIRITSLDIRHSYDLASALYRQIGHEIDGEMADSLLQQLIDAGSLDQRKATLIRAAIRREVSNIPASAKPMMHAALLRSMLLVILS